MKLTCVGCNEGHDTIEAVLACESAHQLVVLAKMEADERARPKRDCRFTGYRAPIRKTRQHEGF